MVEIINRLGQVTRELTQQLNRDPTPAEIALIMGLYDPTSRRSWSAWRPGASPTLSTRTTRGQEARRGAILKSNLPQQPAPDPPLMWDEISQTASRVDQAIQVARQPVSLETPIGSERTASSPT